MIDYVDTVTTIELNETVVTVETRIVELITIGEQGIQGPKGDALTLNVSNSSELFTDIDSIEIGDNLELTQTGGNSVSISASGDLSIPADAELNEILKVGPDGKLVGSGVLSPSDGSLDTASSSVGIGHHTLTSEGDGVGVQRDYGGPDKSIVLAGQGEDTGPVHRITSKETYVFETCSQAVVITGFEDGRFDGSYQMLQYFGYIDSVSGYHAELHLDYLNAEKNHMYIDVANRNFVIRDYSDGWHLIHLDDDQESIDFIAAIISGSVGHDSEIHWALDEDYALLTTESEIYSGGVYRRPLASSIISYPNPDLILTDHMSVIISGFDVRLLSQAFTVYSETEISDVKMYVSNENDEDVWTFGPFDLDVGLNTFTPDKIQDFEIAEYHVRFLSENGAVSLRGGLSLKGHEVVHMYIPYKTYYDETLANIKSSGEIVRSIESESIDISVSDGALHLESQQKRFEVEMNGLASTFTAEHNLNRFITTARVYQPDGSVAQVEVKNLDNSGNVSKTVAQVISSVPMLGILTLI